MPRPGELQWNERLGRYQDARGRIISFRRVRAATEAAMDATGAEMRVLSEQLRAGSINLAEWQRSMKDSIRRLHSLQASAARGGWAQMSPADWGFVGPRTRAQYRFLDNFARQVAAGQQPLDGRFLRRVDMYAQAGRGTFEDMRRRYEANNNGMTEERRLLGVADHCADCLDAAGQGWQPIGTLPRIGESVCRTNCRCRFEFR